MSADASQEEAPTPAEGFLEGYVRGRRDADPWYLTLTPDEKRGFDRESELRGKAEMAVWHENNPPEGT